MAAQDRTAHIARARRAPLVTSIEKLSARCCSGNDNAIRYTKKDGVTLMIATEPTKSWDTARLPGGELDFESDPREDCTLTLRLQVKRVEQRAT